MTTQPMMGMAAPVRVRAWFGPHLVCEYSASRSEAQAYAATMPFQFLGLSVTISDLDPGDSPDPLPPRRLWSLTVG